MGVGALTANEYRIWVGYDANALQSIVVRGIQICGYTTNH